MDGESFTPVPKPERVTLTVYLEWIRTLPCFLFGNRLHPRCVGQVQAMHVKTRGSGGGDLGNVVPGCYGIHREQHDRGIKTFQGKYCVDLEILALAYTEVFRRQLAAGQLAWLLDGSFEGL